MDQKTSSSTIQTKGVMIALAGTTIWSTTAIFIRHLTESYQLPPLLLAFWRELFVCLGMLLALSLIRPRLLRVPRHHLSFLARYGLILMIFNITWTVSVALNGAAVATVLCYSSPAITVLIAWRLWGEPLGPRMMSAVVLSLAGCVLLSGAYSPDQWDLNPAGIVIGLASGFMYAAYSIFGKSASHRGLNPWLTLTYTFTFAAAFLFLVLLGMLALPVPGDFALGSARELFWLGGEWKGWLTLVILAIGPTLGGYGLYNVSLTYLPAGVANLIASLEPPLAVYLAFILLGERMSGVQIFGSLMVVGGVLLLRTGKRGSRKQTASL